MRTHTSVKGKAFEVSPLCQICEMLTWFDLGVSCLDPDETWAKMPPHLQWVSLWRGQPVRFVQ